MGMADDLGAELGFWIAVEKLDTLARIIRDNGGRLDAEIARVQEERIALSPFEVQLEAKARIVERHPDGGPELAALLRSQTRL